MLCFSVLRRCTLHLFPKGFCEITDILKSTAKSNIRYFFIGGDQKCGCLLKTIVFKILNRCDTNCSPEAPEAFAFTDGYCGRNLPDAERLMKILMNIGKHRFDSVCFPLRSFFGDRLIRGQMIPQYQNQAGQCVSDNKFITGFCLSADLPGDFDGVQSLLLPGQGRGENHQIQGRIVHHRQDIVQMDGTVCTAADEPGMEYNGMKYTTACIRIPATVENSGIDKKTLSCVKRGFLRPDCNCAAACYDSNGFPFGMPVPWNIHNAKIIQIAGNRKSICSMVDKLLTGTVDVDAAFRKGYGITPDGFIIQKCGFNPVELR